MWVAPLSIEPDSGTIILRGTEQLVFFCSKFIHLRYTNFPSIGIANTSYSWNPPELILKSDEFSVRASAECEDASPAVASPHYKIALP